MTRIRVFRIASMTKRDSVAAMQLVEAGKLALDEPIGRVLLDLAAPMVIDRVWPPPGIRDCVPPNARSRAPTHTAGFGYQMLNSELIRYNAVLTRHPTAPVSLPHCDYHCGAAYRGGCG